MALKDWFKKKTVDEKLAYTISDEKATITEQFKAKIEDPQKIDYVTKKVGEPHTVDIELMQKWFRDDAFVQGAIKKVVDFVVGPGFFVVSKDPRAQEIAEQFIKDTQFTSILTDFVTAGLITGNGYIEIAGPKDTSPNQIKALDPKNIYVKRDEFGTIQGYAQWTGFTQKEAITFEPYEIAHFKHNTIGSQAYGTGIIWPISYALNKKAGLLNDMTMLMSRKANSPYVVTMGDKEKSILPAQADIDSFSDKLAYQQNKHEWVVTDLIRIQTLDFGNIGDKFTAPLELLNQELIFGSQVPAVLMGIANVPEGLAKEQKEAFMFRIKAIQEEVEKVLEEQIFKRLITSHGLNADIEFEWGQPTPETKRLEIETLIKILDQYKFLSISDDMREQIEKRLRELLEFEDAPKQKEEEANEPQPKVPPSKLQRKAFPIPGKPEAEQPKEEYLIQEDFWNEDIDEKLTLKEYVGFNYEEYLNEIKGFIDSSDFEQREYTGFRFTNAEHTRYAELQLSYNLRDNLSGEQVDTLRKVLKTSFDEGSGMATIARKVRKDVAPGDLRIKIPEVKDAEGNILRKAAERTIPNRLRAVHLARTETIRASNQGALRNYENKEVKEVQWIAAVGERTCPYCESQNGKITTITDAQENIPAHIACRCSWAPLIK